MKKFVSRKEYDRVCEQKEKYRKLAEETIKLNQEIILKKGKTIFEKSLPLPFSSELHFQNPCGSCADMDLSYEIINSRDVFGYPCFEISFHCEHQNICKHLKEQENES